MVKLLYYPSEIEEAWRLINQIAAERYHCRPPPLPQFLFGAFGDTGAITGAVGIDFWRRDGTLPLAAHWKFGPTPFPCTPDTTAQIGRWMAKAPGASFALLHRAGTFCRFCGKKYWIAEAKPKIIELLSRAGFPSYKVEGAVLLTDQTPEDGRGYYLEDPPALYMFVLEEMIEVSRQKLSPGN